MSGSLGRGRAGRSGALRSCDAAAMGHLLAGSIGNLRDIVGGCDGITRYLIGQGHGVGLTAFTPSHVWLHIRYARLSWLRQTSWWHLVSPIFKQRL